MSHRIVAGCLALAMLLCAANVFAETEGVTVTDMYGREVTLTEPATRIVALTASDCEILCALGCEDALVGRGEYCDYPPTVLDKPSVQSGYETNMEQILALEPQLVLMSDMAQSEDQVKQLEDNGVKVAVSNAQTIDEVYVSIAMIGKLMGKDAEAQALIDDMKLTFEEIAADSENIGKTVYFEVSPLQWGLWTAGKGTFMDELATMCGLTNAFGDTEGWNAISEEQVIARDPDYIVTITMYFGEGPTPVEEILSREGWQEMKAVKNQAILNADNNAISRPGPRLKLAAKELYEFVYAEEEVIEPAA
ncbi:MAG: ABC transporter substrate-binding protein [Clostridiales bacterium]|nr:ABC transporter substrate-binding protein [Clostridiales bacterium]